MYEKAVTPSTREALKKLRGAGVLANFYLAGGTGAALQLGHRTSEDLDFFSEKPFDPAGLAATMGAEGDFEATLISPGTLWGMFWSTKVSFFYYPYPLLEPLLIWDNLHVASLLDIALMKLIAIAQRGSRKDFVDLYAICLAGYSLVGLIKRLPEKFGRRFSPYHVLRSLVYFADAEAEPPLITAANLDWGKVKAFFEREVAVISRREFEK